MLDYETINLKKYRDTVICFRKDSFRVSFGEDSAFGEEEDYVNWLEEKIAQFPAGFVLVKENNEPIGQLELSIRDYNGKDIGYVHLYYLIKENRGKGFGQELHKYATQFFKDMNVNEYHLRVAPGNSLAIKFYVKNAMEELGSELDGKVIRMKGNLQAGCKL